MDDSNDFESVAQADAFTLLSDSTRLAIIEALWKTKGHEATFSELREAVGMRDSGQFNYHLGKLTDQFVAKADDGYRLRLAGFHVVGSILAGAYATGEDVDPIPMDEPCPACGGSLTFRYEDEWAFVDCADCEITSNFGIPPGVFADYDREEFPDVAQRYASKTIGQVRRGFCLFCEGRMRPTVRTLGEEEASGLPPRFEDVPFVEFRCDRCDEMVVVDTGGSLHDHPEVVAFFADQDESVEDRSFWQFSAVTEDQASVESTDPFRATVTHEAGGAEITLTVDESLEVLDVERSDA